MGAAWKVMDLFTYIDNFNDENKAKAGARSSGLLFRAEGSCLAASAKAKELKKLCDL